MPQAIAAAIIAAVGATGVAATIITVVVHIAVAIALNVITNALFGPKVPKPSDGQQTVTEDIPSRLRSYGINHVGGARTFYEAKNGVLYQIITTHHTEIAEILQHRLNNKVVQVTAGGIVYALSSTPLLDKFKGKIRLYWRMGTADQTAYTQLTAAIPSWTSAHRQRGCANILLICGDTKSKDFGDVYEGSRAPDYSQVRKASKVYDPRKDSTAIIYDDGNGFTVNGTGPHRLGVLSTYEWSDNAALVIGDYWAHEDGYGLGNDAVNWTNIAGEADVSDEVVTNYYGLPQKRYTIWGSYFLATDDRRGVLAAMRDACDAFMWQGADLRANLQVGRWVTPTIHITDDHIISVTASKGPRPQEAVNEVKIVYTDENFDYTEQESAPLVDEASQSLLGRINQRFDIFFAPNHNQASRLGKLILRKSGDRWHLEVVGNMYLLNLMGERFCRITITELGIIGLYFQIDTLALDIPNNTLSGVFSQVMPDDWDFDAALEEGQPPQPEGTEVEEDDLEIPQDLTLSGVSSVANGNTTYTIYASVTPPIRDSLKVAIEYKKSTDAVWQQMTINQDEFIGQSGPVSTGVLYQARAKFYLGTYGAGRESVYSPIVTITIAGDVLAVPTQFDAEEDTGVVTLSARASPQSIFDHIIFYVNTVDDFSTASPEGPIKYGSPGQVVTHTYSPSAGTYYYWAEAYTSTGTASGPTASETVTV